MSQKFDRNQFKATQVDTMKDQEKEVRAKHPSGGSNRAEVLSLKKDGTQNKLRIYPKHPNSKSFWYPKVVHWLKIQATDDNGKPMFDDNGKPIIKNRPIFNSKVHGGTEKDVVEEYINAVFKLASEIQDEKSRENFLKHLKGYKTMDGKYVSGIIARTSWTCYGELNGDFGRVELPVTVKDRLQEIASTQDDSEGIIVVDPFTDIDTGRRVFITFNPQEKDPKKMYAAAIDFNKVSPLTDEQFEKLCEQKSLEEIYTNCYKAETFQLALEGLKRFDEESVAILKGFGFNGGYGIFSYDTFLDTCEEIAAYYEDPKSDDEPESEEDEYPKSNEYPITTIGTQNATMKEQTVSQQIVTYLSIDQLSSYSLDELKDYIEHTELQIRILPRYTKEDLLEFIKQEQDVLLPNLDEAPQKQESEKSSVSARASRLDKFKSK